ncbi:MAG: ABC transporter permease subunit [Rhodospirillaceae bacterium]|nr:ABC transporter permease subunit [Rhodospirillaceae bacterium]
MTTEASSSPSVVPRQRRSMKTAKSVIIADKTADWVIRVGGLAVIFAVFGIMIFLAQVVVPLFTGGHVQGQSKATITHGDQKTLFDVVDEYRALSVAVDASGALKAFHIKTGTPLEVPSFDFGGQAATAFANTLSGGYVGFGFGDGTLRLGRLVLRVTIIDKADAPADLKPLGKSGDYTDGSALYTPISETQTRRTVVQVELGAAQQITTNNEAITSLDYRVGGTAERPSQSFITIDNKGIGRVTRSETKKNFMTGKETVTLTTSELPGLKEGVVVSDVLMTEKADQVYIAEKSGTVYRYDTRDFDNPELAETTDVALGDVNINVFGFLIGEQSIVVGGSDGSVNIYFRLPGDAAVKTTDGFHLVRTKTLEPQPGAIVAMDVSQRGKTFATADIEGNVWLRHGTSEQVLLRLKPQDAEKPLYETLALAPRQNAVLAVDAKGNAFAWDFEVPHPETTLKTIFGKVWYEGYPEPTFTWQSSASTDAFEPKLSLIPLIFGTIKATVYSLLFAVPIALGAAVFTSEFVHAKVRAVVKPTMEMMASLPSVVLGFIAALVLAPIVETWITAVMMAFFVIPLGLFFGAYMWQLTPYQFQLRYDGLPKFVGIIATLLLFGYLSYAAGPVLENMFFASDFKAWTNGTVGSGTPFTALVLLPVVFIGVWIAADRFAGSQITALLRSDNRLNAGLADLARWVFTLIVGGIISYALASVLTAWGIDVRGGVVDTYVQRNTLVVAFAMGFAVIPIIYTIAEDALNSVPEHLRAASLGCGATPWQTATAVILPAAMSGVFAAIMVGMGRAVGETMIVVMAAGNTPLIEWNLFEGLRALSANIAVELPEAVRDSTLYRMLFLAALTLFVMTFVVNTLAELVRQKFRKRTAQL